MTEISKKDLDFIKDNISVFIRLKDTDVNSVVGQYIKPKTDRDKIFDQGLYYWIDQFNLVNTTLRMDGSGGKRAIPQGDIYLTREEAQRIADNRRTRSKLKEFSFVPEFEDGILTNCTYFYTFGYDGTRLCRQTSQDIEDYFASRLYGGVFESKEIRQRAVELVGEEAVIQLIRYGVYRYGK